MSQPPLLKPYSLCLHNESSQSFSMGKTKDLSIGIMEPLYINVKPYNARKLSGKPFSAITQKKQLKSRDVSVWQEEKKRLSQSTEMSKDVKLYQSMVNNMNEYFGEMKMASYKTNLNRHLRFYKNRNNKSKAGRERNKMKTTCEQLEDLRIRSLKNNELEDKEFCQGAKLNIEPNIHRLGRSVHRMEKQPIDFSKSQTHIQPVKIMQRLFQKSPLSDAKYFFLGKIQPNTSPEEAQRLKFTYYCDFIQKVQFNIGYQYSLFSNSQSKEVSPDRQNGRKHGCSMAISKSVSMPIDAFVGASIGATVNIGKNKLQLFRFYVGRGNNSRLIRRLMAKRQWWREDNRIEEAHFVWSQLKVYNIYCGQSTGSHLPLQPTELEEGRDKFSFILSAEKRKLFEKQPKRALQKAIIPYATTKITITNHLQFSRVIGNKKALYRTMMSYLRHIKDLDCCEGYIPLTFHITEGLEDEQYLRFLSQFYRRNKQSKNNCWIVKPGELSNRGTGIQYCRNLLEIKQCIKQKQSHLNGSPKTFLIQEYLLNPLLYQSRKFDIRHYIMYTSTFGTLRGYFYQEGYIRTTGYKYSTESSSREVHLTNDAVQKNCKNYGKYEKGNKLSYQHFDRYLLQNHQPGFYQKIYPQIREISRDILRAGGPFVDQHKRINNFEVFGIDIMVDNNYKCFLIEVNANPCLEVSCPVLAAVIPDMLDNALMIGLDSLIAPTEGRKMKVEQQNMIIANKFELVYQSTDAMGRKVQETYEREHIAIGDYGDDDENYESCQEDDDPEWAE